jgi:hypothetical protein
VTNGTPAASLGNAARDDPTPIIATTAKTAAAETVDA